MRHTLIVAALALIGASSIGIEAQRPLPVIDVHLHASSATSQGPPPLAVCVNRAGWPVWDQRTPWGDTFFALVKNPTCGDPVWSPSTDDELRQQTIAVLQRRNVVGVLGGTPSAYNDGDKMLPIGSFLVSRWNCPRPTSRRR